MRRFSVTPFALLFLVGLLSAHFAAPAHAASTPNTPLSGILGKHPLAQAQPNGGGGNILLNADIIIVAVDSYTTPTRQVVTDEGWLQLAPKGAGYAGTFTDNWANGKVYPVTATNVSTSSPDGTYTINTYNGKFVITVSNNGNTFSGTVPAKLGGLLPLLEGEAHAYTTAAPLSATFGQVADGFTPLVTGTLSLVYDANHIIVPFNKMHGINSSFTYSLDGHATIAPITSLGAYYPPDGSNGGSLDVVVKIGKTTFGIYNAQEQDSGSQRPLVGYAYGGSGPQTILTSFTAR